MELSHSRWQGPDYVQTLVLYRRRVLQKREVRAGIPPLWTITFHGARGFPIYQLSSRESRITLLLGERTCEVFVGADGHVGDGDLGAVRVQMADQEERIGAVDII